MRGALTGLSRQQWALRLVTVVATAGFLAAASLAGGGTPVAWTVAAVLLCGGAVAVPDSAVPLGLVLCLGAQWLVTVPVHLGGWTLAAGLAVLAVHLSCALAAAGPPGTRFGRRLATLWAVRAGVLALVTVATWGVARALAGGGLTPSVWLTAVALLVVAGAAFALLPRLVVPRAQR